MDAALSSNMEDYLEAVLKLERSGRVVRAKDIAAELGVSRPSVSGALRALSNAGLIRHERYGHVELTEAGRERAEKIHHSHETLSDFLRDILQLSDEEAQEQACEIEHHLRPETRRRLTALMEFIRECGPSGADWLDQIRLRWEDQEGDGPLEDGPEGKTAPRGPGRGRGGGPRRGPHGPVGETLAQQRPGFRGRVLRVGGWGPVRRRLMEMGVTAGADVEFERVAPLGDPLEIKVRGYHLSLRRAEAEQVWVEPIGQEASNGR
jgi:DtxR family Mn-dependent transcriptional regulator